MIERDFSAPRMALGRESGAVVLIRLCVGVIFAGDGVLKFIRPDALGPGRFNTADIPAGTFLAYLDGVFEIGCGSLIVVGLFTRLATLPMIVDMLGALGITKVPMLWGRARCTRRKAASGISSTRGALSSPCYVAVSSC